VAEFKSTSSALALVSPDFPEALVAAGFSEVFAAAAAGFSEVFAAVDAGVSDGFGFTGFSASAGLALLSVELAVLGCGRRSPGRRSGPC